MTLAFLRLPNVRDPRSPRGGGHTQRWARLLAALLFSCLSAFSGRAMAGELEDFEEARSAYSEHNYEEAARRFERLVGGAVPQLRNEVLVIESRKYLGAAYLFVDREDDARQQFSLLLEADSTYQLDPLSFPQEVLQVFDSVRTERAQAAAQEEQEAQQRLEQINAAQIERILLQQERMRRLEALAQERVVERTNSRWIAALPFGIGQFQNGDRSAGIAFLTIESALALGTVATWGWHQWLGNRLEDVLAIRDEDEQRIALESFEQGEFTSRVLNIGMFSALMLTAIIGIVHAQARFVPVDRDVEERPLPDDLPEAAPPPAARLRFEGTGFSLLF